MRIALFPFISGLVALFLSGCGNKETSSKIQELEERVQALEANPVAIEKFEQIQQIIPVLEAVPLTIDKVDRIDKTLIDVFEKLKTHGHSSE